MLKSEEALRPCPICGKKAHVVHIKVDGFDFGWDAGCPAFKCDDGIHGISFDDTDAKYEEWPRVTCKLSRSAAVLAWNSWVDAWEGAHGA